MKIGRTEKISFPDLNVIGIFAKIDTGAYTSSLHVDGMKIEGDNLVFWIDDLKNQHVFNKYKTVEVKSSFGKIQKRYAVLTRVLVGDKSYKIYITLANRRNMKYPALIGRRFLNKFNYIVDVRKENLNDRNKKA